MAKSKSGEFYTFDEVLKQLQIDEGRLKRLVSEGEIRAFREGDQMRFKRTEIDALAGQTGGSGTSDTSLTEISLEDESQPTVSVGAGAPETLADELVAEPEISSQDTYIDQADVGMSTEPIDFTEDEGAGIDEEIEDIGIDRPSGRGARAARPSRAPRPAPVEEPKVNIFLVLALALSVILGAWAALVAVSVSRGHSSGVTRLASETFDSQYKEWVKAHPQGGD